MSVARATDVSQRGLGGYDGIPLGPSNPMGQDSESCNLCDHIIRLAGLPLEDKIYEYKVGKLDKLRTSLCMAHKSIIVECEKRERSVISEERKEIALTKRPTQRNVEVLLSYHPILNLSLLPTEEPTELQGLGQTVDPAWIDLGTLRDWKTKCFRSHGNTCNRTTAWRNTFSDHPKLLIDTKRMCIVHADPSDSYIALSYVWGGIEQLKTTESNFNDLLLERSLVRPEWQAKIPRTVSDAIQLTGFIGERYIWIDSLCIIEDNNSFKHDQIRAMASIYANACLTIIAANGEDSAFGLHGVRGVSKMRNFPQQVYQLSQQHKFIHCPQISMYDRIWSKRAWTFQEAMLSARKLIFVGETVKWQCQCAMWREDVHPDDSIMPIHAREDLRHSIDVNQLALFDSPWPHFYGFMDLVRTFSIKQLTYPEDVLPAFSGMTSALSRTFPGGFLYGIPEMFFDVGLLWSRGVGQLRLRKPSSPSVDIHLPTWSWMGWAGFLSLSGWHSGLSHTKSSTLHTRPYSSMCTVPLVKWYYGDSKCAKRPISNNWLSHSTGDHVEEESMKCGWSRHEHTPSGAVGMWQHSDRTPSGNRVHKSGWYSYRELDHYYTHESDPTSQFWHPIPLLDSKSQVLAETKSTSMAHGELSKAASLIISCTTSRAFMHLGEELQTGRIVSGHEKGEVSIRDSSNRWAGCLILHYHKKFNSSGLSSEEGIRVGDTCELVAISRGFAYNDWWEYHMHEWGHKERPRSGEKYEWYNVLWIGWENGIAKRKAVGRIHKEMWESQALETIELNLM